MTDQMNVPPTNLPPDHGHCARETDVMGTDGLPPAEHDARCVVWQSDDPDTCDCTEDGSPVRLTDSPTIRAALNSAFEQAPTTEGTPTMTTNPTATQRVELVSDQLLTVAEVASALRVSKMTVYRLIHTGALGSVRVGRSFRVPTEALATMIRQQGGA